MQTRLQAIVGATAVVGADLDRVADAAVVLEGETISAAGDASDVEVADAAEVFDGRGLTLVPGFIDTHVHIGFYRPSDLLAGGVTTVRDLGSPEAEIFPLASRSRRDGFDGPRVLAAGPILTAPGGYPTRAAWAPPGTGREVADATQARSAVVDLAAAGAVVVKVALNPPVGPTLDLATLTAIVDEAHEHGLTVTAHVHDLAELDKALRAGIDELAHMLLSNEPLPDGTIERMVDASVTVVPTLAIFSGEPLATAVANLSAFLAAGGRVVYGTDLGNEGPRPGIDPLEVTAMARAGMSCLEIVRSATVDAARHLGLETTGAIEAGHDADVVLVEGDPLNVAADLTRVRAVWRRGRLRAS
ncbi:MAG TPA: amidohydrolase family protein [Actinomycetota bacterium]|nr:amidohydrolase family protein [Actinomycetota bacterium]